MGKGRRPSRPRLLQCHWAAAARSAPPFLHPTPPAGRARPGAGLAWAVDVTAKFAALGAPRVAAATAQETARERLLAQWPRPLTGPAQPDSAVPLPGGA